MTEELVSIQLGAPAAESAKECKSCGGSKPLEAYPTEKRNRDGRAGTCRTCVNAKQAKSAAYKAYQAAYYRRNRCRLLEQARAYHSENSSSISEKRRKHRKENAEAIAAGHANYYRKNKAKIDRYKADYYLKNSDRLRDKSKRYYEENKSEIFRYYRERARKHPAVRMKKAMRSILRKLLARSGEVKRGTTEATLGYSAESLVSRIESQFLSGMGWHNYGEWHIDHKIPISRFLRRGEIRPSVINALSNLQPLWAAENIAKRDSLPEQLTRKRT